MGHVVKCGGIAAVEGAALVGSYGAFVNKNDVHVLIGGTCHGIVNVDEKAFFGRCVGIGVTLHAIGGHGSNVGNNVVACIA